MIERRSFGLFDPLPSLDHEGQTAVENLLNSIDHLTDEQLKTRVYLTKPMRRVLTAEKAGLSQLNRPLL